LLRDALPRKERPHLTGIDANDTCDGWNEVPSQELMRKIPTSLTKHILQAMANMLYVHSDMSKELSSAAALYTTSTGVLADTHGTSHSNRALLALLLEARYEGDLPPREYSFREALRRLLSPAELWWINYLGAVALVLSRVYPAGGEDDVQASVDDPEYEHTRTSSGLAAYPEYLERTARLQRPHHKKPHLSLRANFADDLGSSGDKSGLRLVFTLRMREHNEDDPMKVQEALETSVKKIIKVGKKKHWIRSLAEEDDLGSDVSDLGSAEGYHSATDSDDDDLGWGMEIDVDIKVERPMPK
jgi:retrograde regulation protein 2